MVPVLLFDDEVKDSKAEEYKISLVGNDHSTKQLTTSKRGIKSLTRIKDPQNKHKFNKNTKVTDKDERV